MNNNRSYAKISIIFSILVPVLCACPLLPPQKYNLSSIYGNVPDETKMVSVGQNLSFNAKNNDDTDKFYCPDSGSIEEYKWILPSQAFCVKGANTKQMTCKFSPAGTYDVELQVKCEHDKWNYEYGSYPTYNRYFIRVTVTDVNGPWYVGPDGNDDNNGLSSTSTGAFKTVQTAINAAYERGSISQSLEIIVKQGTYYEQLNFKGKNLNIHSEDPDNWSVVENTIIDANKQGTAVIYGGNESNICQLKGFTIRGGFPTEDAKALDLRFNDTANVGLDSSGKERNGTVNGDPTLVSGRLGGSDRAIQFTGDDFIQIEDYKGVSGNHARSCALWVKTSTINMEMVLMSWGKGITGQKWQLLINGSNHLGIGIWGGRIDGTQTTLTDGNWHHIAVVFGGNGAINLQDIKLYIDGIQEATTCFNYETTPPDVNTELDGHVYIGKRTESPESCYIGVLDDVCIYSRNLSEAEIGDMAFDCILPVHLKLDGNASNAVSDQYNGTVVDNPNWISSGRIIGALDLDGDKDCVTLPSGILNPAEMSFSIFVWVRPDQQTISSYQAIVQQCDEGTNWGRTLLLRTADNKLSSSLGNSSTTTSQVVFSQADQWYHVGITYGGQKVTLYVNGQQVASASITAESCNAGLIVGRHKTETAYWNGAIDDLRIYKGVIGPDEIQQIFVHEDPVAHWAMDTISGNTIADSSLYNRSGTFSVSSPTSTCSDGRLDNAISLQNNEYIRISGWNGITGGNSRTTTAWVKTTPIPTASQMVCTWGNSANGEKWMFRVETTGQIALGVWGGYVSGTTIVADGNWHHVAAVLNSDGTPTVGEVQLYVDGRLETLTSTTPSQAIITSDAENVLIGTRHQDGSYYNYFTGGLDDVRIYDRALNQIQIQEMAANPGPIAHWTLDETSSPSADSSGNTISGTWNGSPTSSVDGYLAGAMEFDGENDYISTDYRGVLGNRDRTVSAWIKAVPQTVTTSETMLRSIVSWGGDTTGGTWNLAVNYVANEGPNGTIRLAANYSKVVGTTRIDDNRWHHVAAVFSNDGTPTVNDIQLYIDGKKEVISYAVDAALNTGTGYNVTLGAVKYQTNDPIFFFNGKIDDVRIYDRALSDADLWQIYRASVGGGVAGHGTSASIEQCIIKNNHSSSNGGGVGSFNGKISRCYILNNTATDSGGGLADCGGDIINCIIAQENTAQNGGGLYNCTGKIINCTIADNVAMSAGALKDCIGSNSVIKNCIIWDNGTNPIINCTTPSYCCYPDGTGTNINTDPYFINSANLKGDDGLLGTYDDGYAIVYGGTNSSPSIDAGDDVIVVDNQIINDITSCERVIDGNHDGAATEKPDMGAYEYRKVIYVDGSIVNNGDGSSWQNAFKYLNAALSAAVSGCEIWVADGIYKPGQDDSNPDGLSTSTFTIPVKVTLFGGFKGYQTGGNETGRFQRNSSTNEVILSGDLGSGIYCSNIIVGADNMTIDGFTITGASAAAIKCDATSPIISHCVIHHNGSGIESTTGSPTISTCTIVDNTGYGVSSSDYHATILNSILWGNNGTDNEYLNCIVTYSCIQDGCVGDTNIAWNPYFEDAGNNNYHLKTYSMCIDSGSPASDCYNEPSASFLRIDMGAYGNTSGASIKSADSDSDGLPDDWEIEYWGDITTSDGGGDSENSGIGDGFYNLIEYQQGYNPLSITNESLKVAYVTASAYQIEPPAWVQASQYLNINIYLNKTEAIQTIITDSDSGAIVRTISMTGVSGSNTMAWDGKDDDGKFVARGFYDIKVKNSADAIIWTSSCSGKSKPLAGPLDRDIDDYDFKENRYKNNPIMIISDATDYYRRTIEAKLADGTLVNTIKNNDFFGPDATLVTWSGHWGTGPGIHRICNDESSIDFGPLSPITQGLLFVNYQQPISIISVEPYRILASYGENVHITYNLAYDANVTVKLSDKYNNEFYTFTQSQTTGTHTILWGGKDESGKLIKIEGEYSMEISSSVFQDDHIWGSIVVYK
jgi:hypothetical protein